MMYFCGMIAAVVFQERVLAAKDWVTLVFLLCLILITVVKTNFSGRFSDFLRLLVNDKYVKIYRDPSNLMNWFTIALFVVQLLSISYFVQLCLSFFGLASKYDYILFIRLFTLLSVFVLGKFLTEKIIGAAFNIDEIVDGFNLQKVNYRTYLGLLLLPVNIVLFYFDNFTDTVIYIVLGLFIAINVLTYFNSLKIYQNVLSRKVFYFILYLCALEIAPYFFIYSWFIRS